VISYVQFRSDTKTSDSSTSASSQLDRLVACVYRCKLHDSHASVIRMILKVNISPTIPTKISRN